LSLSLSLSVFLPLTLSSHEVTIYCCSLVPSATQLSHLSVSQSHKSWTHDSHSLSESQTQLSYVISSLLFDSLVSRKSRTGSLSTCLLIAFCSKYVFLYGFVPLVLLGVLGFFFFFFFVEYWFWFICFVGSDRIFRIVYCRWVLVFFYLIFVGLILIDDCWFVVFIAVTDMNPYIYPIWLGGNTLELFYFFTFYL
jgi:uncharacterized membrane-anchored protein